MQFCVKKWYKKYYKESENQLYLYHGGGDMTYKSSLKTHKGSGEVKLLLSVDVIVDVPIRSNRGISKINNKSGRQ